MENKSFVIVYKMPDEMVKEIILPISEDDYKDNLSYRENVENLALQINDEGGFWVNETTIIPYHRILAIKCFSLVDDKKVFRKFVRSKREPIIFENGNGNPIPNQNTTS